MTRLRASAPGTRDCVRVSDSGHCRLFPAVYLKFKCSHKCWLVTVWNWPHYEAHIGKWGINFRIVTLIPVLFQTPSLFITIAVYGVNSDEPFAVFYNDHGLVADPVPVPVVTPHVFSPPAPQCVTTTKEECHTSYDEVCDPPSLVQGAPLHTQVMSISL